MADAVVVKDGGGAGPEAKIHQILTQLCDPGSMDAARHPAPEIWIDQVFAAKAVKRGGVIRRSVALVEREIGRDRFVAEVQERKFHLMECGGQFVVVCNRNPIRMIL